MIYRKKNNVSVEAYVNGILAGDRIMLSQAITLTESTLEEDTKKATQIIDKILPKTGNSIRVGVTGVPGVGKSTFIEELGVMLTAEQKKLAVLAIDPSSKRTKGSILGDKTRMESLSTNPLAYIRPSASGDTLGGVANKTREAILLCEAAGFEVILIETVGVGQSEVAVKGMVDFFLLLMLAGAGDELQGIKKGIMEMADGIAITKAEGDNEKEAKKAKMEYQNALHLFPVSETGWDPKVLTCSATAKKGIREVWEMISEHAKLLRNNGMFEKIRQQQNVEWMFDIVMRQLKSNFDNSNNVKPLLENKSKYKVQSIIPSGIFGSY